MFDFRVSNRTRHTTVREDLTKDLTKDLTAGAGPWPVIIERGHGLSPAEK